MSSIFDGETHFTDDSDLNLDYEPDEYDDDEDDFDDEPDEEYLRDEYEYYDEWLNRDPDLWELTLDEYEEMRCIEDYGDTAYYSDDDDSFDPY